MRFYGEQILPRLTDFVMRDSGLAPIRARVAGDLAGEVLEIGFGSGLNVPHYPAAVVRVLAVDPATIGRRVAAKRVAASSVSVEYVGLDGQRVPLESDSVDHVLSTWTLCTIPDVDRAPAEIHRVLGQGGAMHFAEHGLSPNARVANWQNRLTPLQRRLFGGCHLNRPIDRSITNSGLALIKMGNYYTKGPKPHGYIYEGIAAKRQHAHIIALNRCRHFTMARAERSARWWPMRKL